MLKWAIVCMDVLYVYSIRVYVCVFVCLQQVSYCVCDLEAPS